MHFHLSKPLHGWPQLAGEIGIIVVGVLIALGTSRSPQLTSRLGPKARPTLLNNPKGAKRETRLTLNDGLAGIA